MAIDTLKLVRIEAKYEDTFAMLEMIHSAQNFHPELAQDIINQENHGMVFPNNKIFESFYRRIEKLQKDLDLDFSIGYDKTYTKDEIEQAISKAELNVQKHFDPKIERLLEENDKIAIKRLKEYPLDAIDDGYLHLEFGKVSNLKLAQLYFYKDEPFIFTHLHSTKRNTWIAAIASKEDKGLIDSILKKVDFESIQIPSLSKEKLDDLTHILLDNIYGYVLFQTKVEAYLKYVSIFNEKAVVVGFISEDDFENFKSSFDSRFKIRDFPAESEEGLMPPTKLSNPWFSKPFDMFIEMYGLPKYGSFDPTTFFAITYSFLFGMMFGDVGQGFVLLIVGLYFAKKTDLGAILIRLSISSIFFGFIYGSVFGNEHILKPLLKPLSLPLPVSDSSFTMTLLISAVALGALFILSSIGLNIFLGLKEKDYKRALLTQNGLAGFIFYGFVMISIALKMMNINTLNPITNTFFIGLPLIVILFHEPIYHLLEKKELAPDQGWGGYITESIFELLEVMLSFVANTMSFLRVGGFVLSHAGMMAVVMTLKEMSGAYGIVVMILGNVIVILLEGLIVGIQTLRLEYYEMFSRYYEGGGKKFNSRI